eukprot:CAMPEP_0201597144 /NCGR_PEP_ID=MMETSP0190_2-20130828/193702_1 /ASSEMBLY_ACC=CAM_ASM_000263 /TAXON_ID=37353 /ORGANISM="Rosalina sp." /LENGTH=259 /DNA_ID=CAMNT_0048057947 /DNA_START=83 /DNA_END=862 /DNA_ORIENTATION=-
MAIIKAGSKHETNKKNIKSQMSPVSVQTASVPYSEDRHFAEDDDDGTQMTSFNALKLKQDNSLKVTPMGLEEQESYSNAVSNGHNNPRKDTDKTHVSDAEVIQNMFTDNGTGGDSMYLGSVYNTPQGPEDENTSEAQDQEKIDLKSDARSDNWQRYETNDVEMEELYRTGTELANMNANDVKGAFDAPQNVNNLPPQPEVDTPGGLPMSTAMGPDGKIKMGEKSVDPEILRKWQSNSEDSSSDDNNDALYGKKTPNTPY